MDITKFGVEELKHDELKDIDGGLLFSAIATAIGLFPGLILGGGTAIVQYLATIGFALFSPLP